MQVLVFSLRYSPQRHVTKVGATVGSGVGASVGACVGSSEGMNVGLAVGKDSHKHAPALEVLPVGQILQKLSSAAAV